MKRLMTTALSAVLATTLYTSAQASENVTIGAASVGGTYYVWASGLANALSKAGMNTNVEVTGGPLHNIQLVNAGQLELGLVTAAPAYEGLHGLEWADGTKHEKIRALLPMFPSY
ncbi:MAG: TAXI family TRAP transporter solute-binding subunit, partial [Aquisalimonadaceae bacterium]